MDFAFRSSTNQTPPIGDTMNRKSELVGANSLAVTSMPMLELSENRAAPPAGDVAGQLGIQPAGSKPQDFNDLALSLGLKLTSPAVDQWSQRTGFVGDASTAATPLGTRRALSPGTLGGRSEASIRRSFTPAERQTEKFWHSGEFLQGRGVPRRAAGTTTDESWTTGGQAPLSGAEASFSGETRRQRESRRTFQEFGKDLHSQSFRDLDSDLSTPRGSNAWQSLPTTSPRSSALEVALQQRLEKRAQRRLDRMVRRMELLGDSTSDVAQDDDNSDTDGLPFLNERSLEAFKHSSEEAERTEKMRSVDKWIEDAVAASSASSSSESLAVWVSRSSSETHTAPELEFCTEKDTLSKPEALHLERRLPHSGPLCGSYSQLERSGGETPMGCAPIKEGVACAAEDRIRSGKRREQKGKAGAASPAVRPGTKDCAGGHVQVLGASLNHLGSLPGALPPRMPPSKSINSQTAHAKHGDRLMLTSGSHQGSDGQEIPQEKDNSDITVLHRGCSEIQPTSCGVQCSPQQKFSVNTAIAQYQCPSQALVVHNMLGSLGNMKQALTRTFSLGKSSGTSMRRNFNL